MSLKHKMTALARKPQSYFNLAHESPSGWESVISILKDGVERSSLPCRKLRAVCDSGKEIMRLYEYEQKRASNNEAIEDATIQCLGGDDFLPIMVYCLVVAGLERPCALCELLQELADNRSMLGEVGYYFSCFRASINYMQDISLSEW